MSVCVRIYIGGGFVRERTLGYLNFDKCFLSFMGETNIVIRKIGQLPRKFNPKDLGL